MQKIMQRIKTRREELHLSYQQLADLTGMSKSTLQRYETGGIKNFPLDKLEILAAALKTTPEWILGHSENKPIQTTIYDRIAELCEERQTTITAVCRELKLSRSLFSELKSGRSKTIGVDKMEPLADFFNCTIDYLVGRSDTRSNEGATDRAVENKVTLKSENERGENMSLYMVDVSGMVVVKRHRTMCVYADNKEEAEDKAKKTFAEMQKNSGAVVCDEGNIDLIIKLSLK